jgi:hypothetical protein
MVSPILRINRNMDSLRGIYPSDIIEARGVVGRQTPAEYRNLMPLGSEAELIGEAMWKGVVSGTPITNRMLVDQRNRFIEASAPANPLNMLPLLPQIDDALVKAVYSGFPDGDTRTRGEGETYYRSEAVTKALEVEHERFCDEVSKALWEEIAEGSEFKKAMTTASNLMHVIADQDVTYLYKRPYPFQALIPSEANKGKAANFDIVGPWDLPGAGPGTEDQMFTEGDPSPYNRSQYIKYLYSVYRVTMAAQLAGLAQVPARDMLAIRIDMAQDALRSLRERMMIGVNYSPTDTTMAFRAAVGSTNIAYNGVYQIIQANTKTAGSGANWVTSGGASYDQINKDLDTSYQAMAKYGFQPNIAFTDYQTFGIYRRGLWEHFRTGPITEITSGITKIELTFPNAGGLAMIPHPFLPVSTSTSSTGCIILLDSRLLARRVLWQDMNTQLAQINLSQKGVISAAETLVDKSDVDAASSLQGGVFGIAAP